jgi:hypothetical protein
MDVIRRDGGSESFLVPCKGMYPHDALHFIVESTLGLTNAFWGRIARGEQPEDIQRSAKEGGHASASRAQLPAAEVIELIQAERLVECVEAELWGGVSDLETFREVYAAACNHSHVQPLAVSEAQLSNIRDGIEELKKQWQTHRFSFTVTMAA